MTPFKALYGYKPPAISPYLPGSTAVAQVDQELRSRDELLETLKKNLLRAQSRMKQYFDKKHSERSFQVGDMVFLKLQRYKQKSLPSKTLHKLSAKYFGPFEVLERIGSVAYRIKLPPLATIHDVFHVSLLKKKLGSSAVVQTTLPPVYTLKKTWEPAKVIDTRLVNRRGNAATQWLILWKGATLEEATWEDSAYIRRQFPHFDSDT